MLNYFVLLFRGGMEGGEKLLEYRALFLLPNIAYGTLQPS